MTWRVARSLDTLLAEINASAPNRSKVSDGSIGDAAHASRTSDHNPWVIDRFGVGVVRARDFTHDPADGCDAGAIAEAIRQLALRGHPALGAGAYVIWNRRIASASYGWVWRSYTGSNPHDHHCHVSVATAAAGYDSTAPWGVTTQEDDMPYTPAELKDLIAEAVREDFDEIKATVIAQGEKTRARSITAAQRLARKGRRDGALTRTELDELAEALGVDQADE